MELAEISLIPRVCEVPFRVVWAGLEDFPADPLLYSVAGLRAFPPFAGDQVIVSPFRG